MIARTRRCAAVGVIALFLTQAAHADLGEHFKIAPGPDSFKEKEWQLDAFGAYQSKDREDFDGDTAAFGAGFSYFFTRYFGAGAETSLDKFDWPNHIDVEAIGRYPFQDYAIAPYALAGFGRQFHDRTFWSTHLGAGVEYRFNPTTGIFTDIRRIFADSAPDITLWRFGIRFTW